MLYVVNEPSESFIGEIIGGVISGLLAIIAIILLILFLKQRKKSHDGIPTSEDSTQPRILHKKDIPDEEKVPLEELKEQTVSLLETPAKVDIPKDDLELGPEDDDEVEMRPKFASPIWLQEIHSNKIFNRQKSLLSEDKLKDLAENLPPPPPLPEEETSPAPNLVNGDHQLLSEADEDEHVHHNDEKNDIV